MKTYLMAFLFGGFCLPVFLLSQSKLVKDLRPGNVGLDQVQWAENFGDRLIFWDHSEEEICQLGITDGTEAGTHWLDCDRNWSEIRWIGAINGKALISVQPENQKKIEVWSTDGSPDNWEKIWEGALGQEWQVVSPSHDGQTLCALAYQYEYPYTSLTFHYVNIITTDGSSEGTQEVYEQVIPGEHELRPMAIMDLEDRWMVTMVHHVAWGGGNRKTFLKHKLVDQGTHEVSHLKESQNDVYQAHYYSGSWRVGDRVFWVEPKRIEYSQLSSLEHESSFQMEEGWTNSEFPLAGRISPIENGLAFYQVIANQQLAFWVIDTAGIHPVPHSPTFTREAYVVDFSGEEALISLRESFLAEEETLVRWHMSDGQIDTLITVDKLHFHLRDQEGNYWLMAETEAEGNELYRSDGTQAGTQLLDQFWSGSLSGMPPDCYNQPVEVLVHDSTLYFEARRPDLGVELARSDGSPEGSFVVADDWRGSYSGEPNVIRSLGNNPGIIYLAHSSTHGREWRLLTEEREIAPYQVANSYLQAELLEDQRLAGFSLNSTGQTLLATGDRGFEDLFLHRAEMNIPVPSDTSFDDPNLEGDIGMGWITQFQADGSLNWARAFPTPSDDYASQVVLTDNSLSYLIMSGWWENIYHYPYTDELDGQNLSFEPGATVVQFDAEGEVNWVQKITGGKASFFARNFTIQQAEALGDGMLVRGKAFAPLSLSRGGGRITVPSVMQSYDPWYDEFSDPGSPSEVLIFLNKHGQMQWHYIATNRLSEFAIRANDSQIIFLDGDRWKQVNAGQWEVTSVPLQQTLDYRFWNNWGGTSTVSLAMDDAGATWLQTMIQLPDADTAQTLIARFDDGLSLQKSRLFPVRRRYQDRLRIGPNQSCFWMHPEESLVRLNEHLEPEAQRSLGEELPEIWKVEGSIIGLAGRTETGRVDSLILNPINDCWGYRTQVGMFTFPSNQMAPFEGNIGTSLPIIEGNWVVGPNPIEGPLSVLKLPKTGSDWTFQLVNTQGQTIIRPTTRAHVDRRIELPATLAPGVYFLRLMQEDQQKVVKLLKR